jgi:hypothetical protein
VRQYVTILARMREDLMPSTRAQMIKALGWHLGPAWGTREVTLEKYKAEPAWLLDGRGWVMNKLATVKGLARRTQEK